MATPLSIAYSGLEVCETREVIGSILITIVAALAFSACSGGDGATSSATAGPVSSGAAASNTATTNSTPTDVCALVTFQEVSAALGLNAADRAATVPPVPQQVAAGLTADVSACAYSAATGEYVRLDLWEAKGQVAKIKQATEFACSDKEKISGLGDFACWYSEGHREIQFAKGGAHVDIRSASIANEPLKSLAEKAIARLP